VHARAPLDGFAHDERDEADDHGDCPGDDVHDEERAGEGLHCEGATFRRPYFTCRPPEALRGAPVKCSRAKH
jgi:hypothetical protein